MLLGWLQGWRQSHCTDVQKEKLEFQRSRPLLVAYVQRARACTLYED
jgi:hypothetical protein